MMSSKLSHQYRTMCGGQATLKPKNARHQHSYKRSVHHVNLRQDRHPFATEICRWLEAAAHEGQRVQYLWNSLSSDSATKASQIRCVTLHAIVRSQITKSKSAAHNKNVSFLTSSTNCSKKTTHRAMASTIVLTHCKGVIHLSPWHVYRARPLPRTLLRLPCHDHDSCLSPNPGQPTYMYTCVHEASAKDF